MSVSGTAARLGKKYSPEHCAALSKSRAMREPATAETRGKMSISARKRDRSGGYSADQKASIRAGILAFWQARRERGLPLKHPRKNK
jgi:hypothetical protein